MQMTEAQIAASSMTLGPKIFDLIAGHSDGDLEDVALIGALSCVASAMAMFLSIGDDAGTALAKVIQIAESAAQDMAA